MNNLVVHYERNTVGRDLIVGDIHGHFSKLQQALDAINFDPERDRLFSVGDLVDRGPESEMSLEWLDKPWFFAVSGNHEDMAIRWPNGFMDSQNYVANGGGWNVSNPWDVSREFAEAFSTLPVAIELETASGLVGIVHADCPFPSWQQFIAALKNQSMSKAERERIVDAAQWSRDRITQLDDSMVDGVRAVVVGHTPMGRFTTLGNVLYIDTMGWRGRDFTILDAATLRPAEKPSALIW